MLSRVQRAFVRLVRPVAQTQSQLPPSIEKEREAKAALKLVRPDEQKPQERSGDHPDAETQPQAASPGPEQAAAPMEGEPGPQPQPQPEAANKPQVRGSTDWWMSVIARQQQNQEELRMKRGRKTYQGSKLARKGFRFTPGTLLNRKAE